MPLTPKSTDALNKSTENAQYFDTPALGNWRFTGEEAARITQPVLNMVGADTKPYFREIHEMLKTWFPHAENFVLPDTTHCMLQMNPNGAAERLVTFFSSHPIRLN